MGERRRGSSAPADSPPAAAARPSWYVRELDGLRGSAIAAVMLFHADTRTFQGGFIGVDVFFVLSGFLITTLLVRELEADGRIGLKRFYARRLLRLAPALITMLVLVVIAGAILLPAAMAKSNVIDALIALFYFANWARAFDLHPPNLFFGHTWSLSIEEQFYLTWPPLLIALGRTKRPLRNMALAAGAGTLLACVERIALAEAGFSMNRLYNGLDTRADCLLAGCLLAILLSNDSVRGRIHGNLARVIGALAPVAAVGLLIAVPFASWQSMHLYTWGFIAIELAVATLILRVLLPTPGVLKSILSARPIVWLGTLSYGAYLWHFPVYRLMSATGFRSRTVLLLGPLVTLAIAHFSYRIVETPFLRMKNRFAVPAGGNPVRTPPIAPEGAPSRPREIRSH